MDREAGDADVIVEETREAQKKHKGRIKTASFDRGFYSAENEEQLSRLIDEPCLAPRHPKQYAECLANGSVESHRLRQRHPGVESNVKRHCSVRASLRSFLRRAERTSRPAFGCIDHSCERETPTAVGANHLRAELSTLREIGWSNRCVVDK